MEHNIPANTRHNDLHDPKSNGAEIGIAHNLINSRRNSKTSLDQAEHSYPSAYHASTTGRGMTTPSPKEEPFLAPPPPLRQPQSPPVVVPIGDSQGYPPSPPFEEAGPRSSVWRACFDESLIDDNDTLRNQRGEVNILLVFAGLFSAVVSTFITQSLDSLKPDYQAMSAKLLFDQINIQRALANGTSLDDITTSGTDPTAPFTPHSADFFIYGCWLTSLILSLVAAFFAILVDGLYCHYVSPIAGERDVRFHIRYLLRKDSIKLLLRIGISFLRLLLYLSLIIFVLGLLDFVSEQSRGLLFVLVSLPPFLVTYLLFYFWKVFRDDNLCEVDDVPGSGSYDAHKPRIEDEVYALHWLYERSSTLATHRLVIQALAGLSPAHTVYADEDFSLSWVEIRDEKERMLMDCMELARDGTTRWIPKDIPNISGRIEPLLRLEILFPPLRREFPSRLFGGHNLDFSKKLSNTLSITLSSIDDTHIQKHTELKQVLMDALAENSVHHPLVWKKLLGRYVDKGRLFHDARDVFTIEMCLNLVTSIYLPKYIPQFLCSCTLADASVTYHKPKILKDLLSVFSTSESQNDAVNPQRRLSLAIVHALVPNSAPETNNSHQPHPFQDDSTISKYRLLRVSIGEIQKDLRYHPVDPPSKEWRTDVFRAIVSFMMSDLFTGRSLSDSEYSEFKDDFWTGSTDALACMASFMGGDPKHWVIEPNAEWDTKPLFLNILQVIHDERVVDVPSQTPFRVYPDLPVYVDSAIGAVGLLLDQAFKQGIPGVYEAFRENGTLRYIAEKSRLHLGLIEGLQAYITGLSDAKAGKFPDIQSDEFPDRHIHDLHEAPVIRCICASITYSGLPPCPILSSLASIDPNHSRWTEILDTLNSPDHEYSINNYSFDPIKGISLYDRKCLKKSMEKTLCILTECLKAERARRNGINWVTRIFNYHTSSAGNERVQAQRDDIELGR